MRIQSLLTMFGYDDYSELSLHLHRSFNADNKDHPLFELCIWQNVLNVNLLTTEKTYKERLKETRKHWIDSDNSLDVAEDVFSWIKGDDITSVSKRIKAAHDSCGCLMLGLEGSRIDWNVISKEFKSYKDTPDWYTEWDRIREYNNFVRMFSPKICGMSASIG